MPRVFYLLVIMLFFPHDIPCKVRSGVFYRVGADILKQAIYKFVVLLDIFHHVCYIYIRTQNTGEGGWRLK